jgi:CRP-like cAMP-binding protein
MRQTMTTEDKLAVLQSAAHLPGWAEAQLEQIATRAVEAVAAPGDVLARESRPGGERSVYLVMTGEATIGRNGTIVDRVGPGAILGNDDAPATITAVTLMHLLVLEVDVFAHRADASGPAS